MWVCCLSSFSWEIPILNVQVQECGLKGHTTLKHIVFWSKELYKPWISIQIWSKLYEN